MKNLALAVVIMISTSCTTIHRHYYVTSKQELETLKKRHEQEDQIRERLERFKKGAEKL